MRIEDGLVYCFQFKQADRATAAKLAYEIESLESNNGSLNKIIRAAKAFFSRKVIITSVILNIPSQNKLTERLDRDICSGSITNVTTTMGVDYIRKRGDAQHYARKVIVRTWPYKEFTKPGHGSLSIKDETPSIEEPKHIYLSWWPCEEIKSTFNGLLNRVGLDDLMSSNVIMGESYREDKKSEIGWNTMLRLISGAGNYNSVKNSRSVSEEEKAYAEACPIKPRARQVKIRNDIAWGIQADKVYIPLVGPNATIDGNKPVFSLFGLNEFKMEAFVMQCRDDVVNKKARHSLLVAGNTCSGMVLTALRKGGADYYTKTTDAMLITDPNLLHKISIRLHNRIDGLNEKSYFISEQLKTFATLPDLKEQEKIDNNHQLKDTVEQLSKTMIDSGIPNRARHNIKRVRDCFNNFNNTPCSLDDLTPKTIKLVEALYEACGVFDDNQYSMSMLKPALESFEVIKSVITEACSEESSKKEVGDLPFIQWSKDKLKNERK